MDEAATPEGRNRYIVEGLPLKTYDCSQITDGYAGLLLATEEGLAKLGVAKADCVEIAGYGQATDPLLKAGREIPIPTLGGIGTAILIVTMLLLGMSMVRRRLS